MKDIVVTETLEDIDKDGDGSINVDEYIGDMYRDRNGDGVMDLEEVKAWIIPPDYDHSEAEAKHLLFEADIDHDNLLTKDEILEKYDIFVGSQATDFGEALTDHDEF